MAKDSIEQALSVLEAEKANLSPEQLQRLAELADTGEGVREDVTDTLETTEKCELSPEQADSLVSTLKSRFELPENKKLSKTIDFADVEKSLRASPEKLYVLYKLEETGGEPQVIGIGGDEFVFEDRCIESPSGRRDLDADQAAEQADEFGADMQNPDAYKAMQKTGKYDLNSGSWLKTDPEYRKRTGYAMGGARNAGGVRVSGGDAEDPGPDVGWRGMLRVPKA